VWKRRVVTNVEGAVCQTCRGVPGVIPERFEEGLNVRHCALSLVGEPIIYPSMNELLQLMHDRGISSFLVTNAQFPDKIETLKPATQLYVSIDAPTEGTERVCVCAFLSSFRSTHDIATVPVGASETLKRIDRPLFTDFWQRFLDCLAALSRKRQRTVYRLTLVKGWNVTEVGDRDPRRRASALLSFSLRRIVVRWRTRV